MVSAWRPHVAFLGDGGKGRSSCWCRECVHRRHRTVRDLLQADGMDEKVGGLDRAATLDRLLADEADRREPHRRR